MCVQDKSTTVQKESIETIFHMYHMTTKLEECCRVADDRASHY